MVAEEAPTTKPDAKLRLGRNRWARLGRLRYGERRPLRRLGSGAGCSGGASGTQLARAANPPTSASAAARYEAALSRGSCQT